MEFASQNLWIICKLAHFGPWLLWNKHQFGKGWSHWFYLSPCPVPSPTHSSQVISQHCESLERIYCVLRPLGPWFRYFIYVISFCLYWKSIRLGSIFALILQWRKRTCIREAQMSLDWNSELSEIVLLVTRDTRVTPREFILIGKWMVVIRYPDSRSEFESQIPFICCVSWASYCMSLNIHLLIWKNRDDSGTSLIELLGGINYIPHVECTVFCT